jgi:4-hydroxy-4-methyl-2-oxoglutarate aldolase
MGFAVFAGNVAVSHAFAHLVEFGHPVEIAGLRIAPGDLLAGDRHGLLSVPPELVPDLPARAAALLAEEKKILDFCRSPEFGLEKLRALVRNMH